MWLILKMRKSPDPVYGPDALEKDTLRLENALQSEGVPFACSTVKEVFSNPSELPNGVSFVYGPTLAAQEAQRILRLRDRTIYTTVNCYMYFVPHFNDLGHITSYGKAVNGRFEEICSAHNVSQLFIRPVSHDKRFNGSVMSLSEIKELDIDEHYRIMLAPPRNTSVEWRVLVENGKAITGSKYKPDKIEEIPDIDFELVHYRLMELSPAFPKLVFLDFADSGMGPELLEVTPLISAGMYEMDRREVVKAIQRDINKQA